MKAEREKINAKVKADTVRLTGGKLELTADEEMCTFLLVSEGSCTLQMGENSLLLNPGSALLLGAGLQVRSLGLCLCKDLLGFGFRLSAQSAGSGIGVFVCCEHRCNVFISRSLRRFKHLIQLQCSLRNGTCVFNMDLPFLQLGRQGSVFCPELVLALLERQNDLD